MREPEVSGRAIVSIPTVGLFHWSLNHRDFDAMISNGKSVCQSATTVTAGLPIRGRSLSAREILEDQTIVV